MELIAILAFESVNEIVNTMLLLVLAKNVFVSRLAIYGILSSKILCLYGILNNLINFW